MEWRVEIHWTSKQKWAETDIFKGVIMWFWCFMARGHFLALGYCYPFWTRCCEEILEGLQSVWGKVLSTGVTPCSKSQGFPEVPAVLDPFVGDVAWVSCSFVYIYKEKKNALLKFANTLLELFLIFFFSLADLSICNFSKSFLKIIPKSLRLEEAVWC